MGNPGHFEMYTRYSLVFSCMVRVFRAGFDPVAGSIEARLP